MGTIGDSLGKFLRKDAGPFTYEAMEQYNEIVERLNLQDAITMEELAQSIQDRFEAVFVALSKIEQAAAFRFGESLDGRTIIREVDPEAGEVS